jgi:hypothetical protein
MVRMATAIKSFISLESWSVLAWTDGGNGNKDASLRNALGGEEHETF